jgi:hypothetical protein
MLTLLHYMEWKQRLNEAVKNNPEKFPSGYLFEINAQEKMNWSKISTGSKTKAFISSYSSNPHNSKLFFEISIPSTLISPWTLRLIQ